MRSKFLLAALSVALLVAGLFYYKYKVPPALDISRIKLYKLNGEQVKLHDMQNRGTFVNFFATWCGPCMAEMPLLYNTQTLLAGKNVLFVYISDEPVEHLQVFERQVAGNMLILHSPKKLSQLGIHTIPTSYLLNSSFKVVFDKTGELEVSADQFAADLDSRL